MKTAENGKCTRVYLKLPRQIANSCGRKRSEVLKRAILMNPRILLLDEATSAIWLDAQKTVLLIAHGLSTVKMTDIVAVVYEGQIVETGTHQDQLLSKDDNV
ncbi:P-loop containing nucleoside triphosphate hydrolase [Trema orientale]|uniref:P-loop containing nucleoside triphosphate hydrolase n=1 Tax=Trema orientale TaxID=63057 RepID=A0A2P5F4I9_TREOI|nr:P-loop containing nucleoside triphosphate hydrolase [Trema orientale]